MKSSTVRRVEPSALASSQQAKRRSRPVLVNAWAMTNITSTKKNTGLMKLVKAAAQRRHAEQRLQHDGDAAP